MQRESFDFETSWSERARDVDVLVLDDLGTEHHDAAGAIERMMEGLLRYRLQRGRVTILTSNISPMKLGPHTEEDRRVDGPYRGKFVEVIREALFPIEVRGRSLREDRERDMAAGYES
jgi:DNA replication protein DnaC